MKQRLSTLEDSEMAARKTTKTAQKTPEPVAPEPQTASEIIQGMPLEELLNLKTEVEKLIKQRQKEQQKELFQQMEELAKSGGFSSATELIESQRQRSPRSDKGVKLPPKYQSPDGKKTWSGKGRVPGWVLEHEADGGDREELEIK